MPIKTVFLIIGIAALAVLPIPRIELAEAQAQSKEVFQRDGELYRVDVRVMPEKPAIGIIVFFVRIVDVQTASPVPQAKVRIVVDNPEGQPTFQAPALITRDSPENFISRMTFFGAGVWNINVEITDQVRGQEVFSFPLDIEDKTFDTGSGGAFIFLAASLAVVAGAIYVGYTVRRAQRRSRTGSAAR